MTQDGRSMDVLNRDGRLIATCVAWGAALEGAADRYARRLTHGLNYRDLLLLADVFERGGEALPSDLIGPVHTTTPGVSGALRRLERAGLVSRGRGEDARTRPLALTSAAEELAQALVEPWARFVDHQLEHLDEAERAELCRLLFKGGGGRVAVWRALDEAEKG